MSLGLLKVVKSKNKLTTSFGRKYLPSLVSLILLVSDGACVIVRAPPCHIPTIHLYLRIERPPMFHD